MEANKSINIAMNYEQGIGFSENTGYWPMPETRTGILNIIDDLEYPHSLVLDYTTGIFYDIYSRDASNGSYIFRQNKDKVLIDDTGGYDIEPEVTFKEDTGEAEKFVSEILSNRFYVRPFKETNRNASGYNSNGYMSGTEFTSYIYVDGEPSTESAKAEDISLNGEIVYDRKAEGHRLYTKFISNKSDFQLVGRNQVYITKDIVYDIENRITTEGDYQYNISSPIVWITRGYSTDIINGTDITISANTTGPDSRENSAIFNDTLSVTIPSGSTNYLSFFGSGSITVLSNGSPISLNTYSGDGSWNLYYVSGIPSGSMIFSGSGETIGLFDIRLFSTGLTSNDLSYMFNDVTENYADNICPEF